MDSIQKTGAILTRGLKTVSASQMTVGRKTVYLVRWRLPRYSQSKTNTMTD